LWRRIVDSLESIEIEEQNAALAPRGLRAARRSIQLILEILAVRNPGESIVARKIVEPRLGALALDRIADRAQNDASVAFPLDEVILNAAVQYLDRELLITASAQHDNRCVRIDALDLLDALVAGGVGQMQIQENDIKGIF
jgi:hypothetical protein